MTVSATDTFEAALARGQWRMLEPWLRADATSVEGKEVRAWFRSRRAHWAKETRFRTSWNATDADPQGCLRLLAVAIAPAAQAARWVAASSWGWRTSGSDDLLLSLMLDRGPAWCQEFLDAAAELKVRKGEERNTSWIGLVARELVRAGAATLPHTPTMATAWAAAYSTGAAQAKWHAWRAAHGHEDTPPPAHTLVDLLREDPTRADGLSLALGGPGAIGLLEGFSTADWDLAGAVRALVDEGLLDRGRVIGDTLTALTRQDTATTQRGLAKLLTSLDLSAADLQGRIPLVQGLLATSRGAVTAALLPSFLDAAGPTDLEELARTVLSRPEKAQQKLLVAALADKGAVERWDRPSVVAALELAADLPDTRLAARATDALERLGESAPEPAPEAEVDGLWAPPPPVDVAGPVEPVTPDARGLTEAASRFGIAATAADAALLTDALVRWCAADARAVQVWAASASSTVFLPALVYVVRDGKRVTADEHRTRNEQVTQHLATGKRPRFDGVSWSIVSRSATGALHDGVTWETTIRLGEIPFLLSTPTHADGSLSWDALLARLRSYDVPAGPLDLALALLRLRPVDPARAADLTGMALPLWSTEKPGLLRRRRSTDAVALVRDWVSAGGLPPLTIRHRGAAVVVDPATLPAGVGTMTGVPGSIASGHDPAQHDEYYEWDVSIETGPGIVPAWVDLLAARMQKQFDQSARSTPRWLPSMTAAPEPGLAVLHAVAQTLCHADEDHRLVAVESALVLMGRGRWDSAHYTACCLHQLADGHLRLSRLAHSWEQVVLGGGLQPLWPTVLAVLDAACALDRKPAGLADLLAVVRRYVAAVPDARLPDPVHVLAGSKGGSKAKLEAQALVEAVR